MPIIDCGIAAIAGDPAYEEGMDQELFIKDVEGGAYLGEASLDGRGRARRRTFVRTSSGPVVCVGVVVLRPV